MANLSFDFNKVKRSFMTVTLKDNRKLIVKMPMKKTFEKLSALQEMDTDSMTQKMPWTHWAAFAPKFFPTI